MKRAKFIKRISRPTDAFLKVIAVTGGPCAGKSTGLIRAFDTFTKQGYKVLVIPETATEFISSGFRIGQSAISSADFQEHVLSHQIEKEKRWCMIAETFMKKGEKVIIFCDRGIMDSRAYLPGNEFENIIEKLGHDSTSICTDRYDGVIHLRTAAFAGDVFYTCENNKARKETAEEAKVVDELTLNAWKDHPKLHVVPNGDDFESKMLHFERCVVEILKN